MKSNGLVQDNESSLLRRLIEIGKHVLVETKVERILTIALDGAIEIASAERGMVILFDERATILFQTARNLQKEDIDNPKFEVSKTIVSMVQDSKQSICLSNALNDPSLGKSQSATRLKLLSVICLPLCHKGRCFGVVYLDNRRVKNMFQSREFEFAESFAEFISLAAYQALERRQLPLRITALEDEQDQRQEFKNIIGVHPKIAEIIKTVRQIADAEVAVLIQGETGTGKELIARALHFGSIRKHKPFVAVNCGAFVPDLMNSEMFGHVKGAFTGAHSDKVGYFERANLGTIFLDEIGEMAPALQVRLLRVLQSGEYSRVGESVTRECHVRVIAATNKDLQERVQQGKFRGDLFYRLNVIDLNLPPLRERKSDLPLLIRHFVDKHGRKRERDDLRLAKEAEALLLQYDYPGNVRELENFIERAVALVQGDTIEVQQLPEKLRLPISGSKTAAKASTLQAAKQQTERDYLIACLRASQGHVSNAAKRAGVDDSNFHKLMKKYHITPQAFKPYPNTGMP